MRTLLERTTPYRVCGEAVDGVDAIEKAKALRPDLILIDFAMPEMNGVEASSVLSGIMPRVPIVLFSIHKNLIGKAIAHAAGIALVLAKPEDWPILPERLSQLLQTC